MADTPIVEIYLRNYRWNGSVVTNETKIQSVPMNSAPVITNPKVKNEIGKAGSFEFGLETNSPYYNALMQMKTVVRVTYFGNTIFIGRVLTIDKTLQGSRTIHCEGALAFFLDSPQPGSKEDTRQSITVLAYLQQLIANHNSYLNTEAIKQFTLGEVPGQYTNATATEQRVKIPDEKASQKFGDTSWNTTMDRLESLISDFGGYFRVRYTNNGLYLDWYDKYYNATVNAQPIEVTKNLIDISGPTEVENLFTVVIPIGKSTSNENTVMIGDYWPIASAGHAKVNYIEVPELATIPLYSDAELNADYHKKTDYQNAITKFGKIWKIASFDNADTPEKLFAYAKDWIKSNFMPEITQWDVTALDLKFVDPSKQVILCGDRVALHHPEVDQTYSGLTAISADYDLYNPEKNKYNIGIPNQEINTSYGVKTKNEKKGTKGISSKPTPKNKPTEPEDDIEMLKEQLQQQYWLKSEFQHDIQLDNPLAFLFYDNTGKKKNDSTDMAVLSETAGDAALLALKLADTKVNKKDQLEAEARRRGVSIDNLQLLIDYTPDVKLQQDLWKTNTATYMENTLGMSQQETAVLLNETAGQSWLASLVTDSGGWSQWAYYQNIPQRTNAAEIKTMAINARKILNGESDNDGWEAVSQVKKVLGGGNLNIGNFLTSSVNDLMKNFDVGDMLNVGQATDAVSGMTDKVVDVLDKLWTGSSEETPKTGTTGTWFKKGFNFINNLFHGNNTESGGKEVEITSDTLNVDGKSGHGTMGMGVKVNNQWPVTANKPITYTDSKGVTHTLTNAIHANDYHLDDIGSVNAELLKCEVILADYAQIGTLVAMEGRISDIEADYLTVRNLTAGELETILANIGEAEITSINVTDLTVEGDFVASGGTVTINSDITAYAGVGVRIGSSGSYYDIKDFIANAELKDNNKTLELTKADGTTITFSKAASVSGDWSGSGNDQIYTVSATAGSTVVGSRNIGFAHGAQEQLNLATNGSPTALSNRKRVSAPVHVYTNESSSGGTTVQVDRYTANLTINATIAWNNGWDDALDQIDYPATAASGEVTTFSFKVPNSARTGYDTKTYTMKKGTPGASGYASVSDGGSHTVARIDISNWYTAGRSQGWADTYKILLDSGNNHANDWWNCRIYNSSGTLLKNIVTDQANTGLYIPFVSNVNITSNGTYKPSQFTSDAGHTAVMIGAITVNVPTSGHTYTNRGKWTCTSIVPQTNGSKTVYLARNYAPSQLSSIFCVEDGNYTLYTY